MGHQLSATFLVADTVRVFQEILLLLVGLVIREMALYPLADIERLAYIDGLAGSIVEVVNAS